MGRPPAPSHGGARVVAAARRHGVTALFTLSGGHIFPVYDAAVKADPPLPLIDVRHEQTAVFAAEATARLTRVPGLAAVTAGPGVTNTVSALITARLNGAPVVVIGGRAPDYRWGSGSLQELDHPAVLGPVTKHATTVHDAGQVSAAVDAAFRLADTPRRGPVFLDIALEALYGEAATGGQGGRARAGMPAGAPSKGEPSPPGPDPADVAEIAGLLARSRRPVLVLGSDVWLDGAEDAARAAAEELRLPVITNGQARGVLPGGHELLVSRARRKAFAETDLVVVVGAPLDFRLGYGDFGTPGARPPVAHVACAADSLATHRPLAASAAGDLTAFFVALPAATWDAARGPGGGAGDRAGGGRGGRAGGGTPSWDRDWLPTLAGEVRAAGRADEPLLASDADPIHPVRIYGELARVLADDAVVIGDGGDFVSFAGRHLEPARPGCWLDPGPFGCLGTGLGYAIAARIARPSAQVVLLLGDGAAGFSLMDADTLARHRLPVVMICGNNGIWGLEKHPMRALYGHDAAADLAPGRRYDEVVRALGGAGETVTAPGDLAPALRRAFGSGVPYLVNVLTDPGVAYPRTTTGV